MHWKIKNFIFHILENVPSGKTLYYFLQRYITKSVLIDGDHFKNIFNNKVLPHFQAINDFGKNLRETSVFEFGAGWDMLTPIGFALYKNTMNSFKNTISPDFSIRKYIAVDLNSYVHPELVLNILKLYSKYINDLSVCYNNEHALRTDWEKLYSEKYPRKIGAMLKDIFNIEYYAPMDAGNTPFVNESIDYVISNATLEHIPYNDINRIFRECYRLLKYDGIMSCIIDYTDHWSYADPSINAFNYMKYSEEQWKKYNPSMHFQNRMQHSDYVTLLKKNGFDILKSVKLVIDSDKQNLERIKLADCFKKYEFNELLIRSEHFIVSKSKSIKN